jgi:3-hydroxyacyl-CoA dehydrogenase
VSNLIIRKVAVLGAGVMGAQIAAHLINAKVPVLLFDLPAKEGPKNAIALKAIENLKKLSPAPFGVKDDAQYIQPANYDDDIEKLAECDLVIEAIAERMDWKHDLYKKVSPHIAPNAIFATNTSGLSITELSNGFSDELKARFCGVHFFNPPRYMHLVELIPTATTRPEILDQLESFLTSVHRQPRRYFLDPRRDYGSRQVRPAFRRSGRPDGLPSGPREVGNVPYG